MGATKREGLVFRWEKPFGAADSQEKCEVGSFILWASAIGSWNVVRKSATEKGAGTIIISDRNQAPGHYINEAKQRAQAAAIVQLQLTGEFNNQH